MSYGSLHVQPVGASAYSFPIDTPVVRIGRDPAHNDLVISDGGISRRHVQIELRQTDGGSVQATVKDLGSANGTTLDGAPIEAALLRPGQVVQAGDTILRFHPPAPQAVTL